jgi:hypothetical protein
MTTDCLGQSDVKELAESTLATFDQEVAALPHELTMPFNQAAMRLEAELLTIYKFVVRIVRREDDLGEVAGWWGTMVSQCDGFAKRLHALAVAHPSCGAGFFYDRVLDLRNKCLRLQEMHS